MKKRYYITGVSGTGKTTLAKELQDRGYKAIDQDLFEYGLCAWKDKNTNELIRGGHDLSREFIESHEWFCDGSKLKKMLDESDELVFVCGVADNQDEYLDYFDKVFLLQCKPEVFLHRLNIRQDNKFGKDEFSQNLELHKYKKFEENLIHKGAIVINAHHPIKEVADKIISKINISD